jgi:hypothetical protein
MTAILLYLAAGLLLITGLLRLFLGAANNTVADTEPQPAHAFWSPDGSAAMHVARQLFGTEDWEYVQRLDSATLKRGFLKERTALALIWVGAARSEARALMRVHRTAASTSPHLNLRAELRIIYAYVGFLFYCALLEVVIRMRGPVALQSFVALTDACSIRLYEAVGQVFPLAEHTDGEWEKVATDRRGRT